MEMFPGDGAADAWRQYKGKPRAHGMSIVVLQIEQQSRPCMIAPPQCGLLC